MLPYALFGFVGCDLRPLLYHVAKLLFAPDKSEFLEPPLNPLPSQIPLDLRQEPSVRRLVTRSPALACPALQSPFGDPTAFARRARKNQIIIAIL